MKNKLRNISILCLTLLIFSIFNLTKVKALSAEQVLNEQTVANIVGNEIEEKTGIPKDKEWKIKFNKSIDSNTAIEKNIYVTDKNSNLVSVSIKLSPDNTEIFLTPNKEYIEGEKYILNIKDLKAKDGSTLGSGIKMTFAITEKEEIIVVKNTKELLDNIGPDRTLVLKAGDYNLLTSEITNNKYVEYAEVFDGMEMIIKNLDNLTIKGEEGAKVQLLVEPRYANVLTFTNCNNINIENVIGGHYPDEGYCIGGVFYFYNCKDVNINTSELFGCGTVGVTLDNVENFLFIKSVIKECSYGIMEINESKNVQFKDSNFYDCREYDLIEINSSTVEFNGCNIYNNYTYYNPDYTTNYFLFQVDIDSKVTVNKGSIKNNYVKDLVNAEDRVIFNNVDIKNNTVSE